MATDNQWGYALVRAGKVVAVEKTLACAKHWVDSEIVPLCPALDISDAVAITKSHGQPEKQPKTETSAPAIIFFAAGSLGEEIEP